MTVVCTAVRFYTSCLVRLRVVDSVNTECNTKYDVASEFRVCHKYVLSHCNQKLQFCGLATSIVSAYNWGHVRLTILRVA